MTGILPGYKYLSVNGDQRVAWISGGEPFITSERSIKTIRRFNQDFHVCNVFDLGSPAQNESVGSRPVLRWDPYPDAGYYLVDVFDRTSSIALEWVVSASVTSFQVDSDLPPGIYQWQVKVVRPRGMIACSRAPRVFTVRRES